MTKNPWLLVYTSLSTVERSRVFNVTLDIQRVSLRNNARDGLTGVLVDFDGRYFQALEGPHDAVQACFKRIASDPRHRDVQVLINRAPAGRRFSRWEMGLVDIYDTDNAPLIVSQLQSDNPEDVLAALVQLASEHELAQKVILV